MKPSVLFWPSAGVLGLAACVEGTGAPSGMPTSAEQAGLRDGTVQTNSTEVVLLDSTFTQAGTVVIVGVGEPRARWRCIAYSDGTAVGILSLTNEGLL